MSTFLGVVVAVWLCAAAAPSKAHAYVGESLVQSGATLTKEVQDLVKVPDYIPKIWEGGGGGFPPIDEVNAWTDFWEAGATVPILSSVVAFGVGTGIGSVICNEILELEGCWYYGSKSADPAVTGGSWVFFKATTTQQNFGPYYQYYWLHSGSYDALWSLGETPHPCGLTAPASFTFKVAGAEIFCEFTKGTKEFTHRYALGRWMTTNRVFEGNTKAEAEGKTKYSGSGYCPVAGPGSTTCSEKPPANWAEREATCLSSPSTCGLTNEQRDHIGQHLAASTPKGEAEGIKDPYSLYVMVPECLGDLYAECKAELEKHELKPVRESLGWEHAVITDPATTVEEITPPAGNEVKVGAAIHVVTNPDTAAMPAVIPQINKGETYAEYAARLNPSLDPTRVNVDAVNEDSSVGPNVALRTDPVEGTREDPASSTAVDVYTNPPDAPIPAEAGSCNLSIGSVDLSPLNQPVGSRFPFGVFAFFVSWVGEWTSSLAAPSFSVHLTESLVLHIDFATVAPYMEVIRLAFLFSSFVGLLWFLGTAGMNLRGDSS